MKFYLALVKPKYQDLYTSKNRIKPGPKKPEQELIGLVA